MLPAVPPVADNGRAMTTADHPKTTLVPASLDPTDGPLTFDELGLAFRNKGMPLEALRYDVTPTGLHYQVLHFDIPEVDPATWRLAIGGLVEKPVELTLDDIRRRPSVTLPVTMECAGNGRGRLRAAAVEPALAARGDRHGRVDRHAAVAADRGGRPDRRRS